MSNSIMRRRLENKCVKVYFYYGAMESVQKLDFAFGICVSFLTWSLRSLFIYLLYLSILDYCEYFVLLRQSNCV